VWGTDEHTARGSRAGRVRCTRSAASGNANRTSGDDSARVDALDALAVAAFALAGALAALEVGAGSAVVELGRTAAELAEAADSAGGESDRTCAAPSATPSPRMRR
jgi:hypothetical protein